MGIGRLVGQSPSDLKVKTIFLASLFSLLDFNFPTIRKVGGLV